MSVIIQSSNPKEFNSLFLNEIGESLYNFKQSSDYTYHKQVHTWTNGNVVVTHNDKFNSFALEIFD